jgi:hypothetical protein
MNTQRINSFRGQQVPLQQALTSLRLSHQQRSALAVEARVERFSAPPMHTRVVGERERQAFQHSLFKQRAKKSSIADISFEWCCPSVGRGGPLVWPLLYCH